MRRFLPLLVWPLLLCACAGAQAPASSLPEIFRTGRDPRFPAERYLIGVGEGSSFEGARRQAVAAIGAQLQASLHATDLLHAASHSGGEAEEHLVQQIRMQSRFERPAWVRVADSHADGGRVHVLCVLDRRQAAALLEAEQEVRRTSLRMRIEAAQAAADLRASAAALAEARRLLQALVPGEATLAALRGRPAPPPGEVELLAQASRALEERRRAVALQVCVEPAVPTGPADDVAARFTAILAGEGLQARPCDAEATAGWRLTGRLVADTSAGPAQPGAYPRFCTVRLDYRFGTEAELVHGGSAGGVRNRAGGHDFHDACQTSAAHLVRGLAVDLGLRDPPAPRSR